jgi:hypothetical protein
MENRKRETNSLKKVEQYLFEEKKPVSFETFCVSPDFCNNKSIYEFWRREMGSLPLTISELVADGSLGGGKSMAVAYYISYRLYCLFLNGDPRPRLDLAPDSPVYVLYFSVSMTMAKRSGFQYLYNAVKSCKWFRDNVPMNENLKSSVSFANGFSIEYASAEGHQIGLNVWGFILDEGNFRSGVGEGMVTEYEEVTMLYTQLQDRQNSRFSQPDGSVDALAILVSSASYQSSFVEKRKIEIENEPNTAIITAVAYEIKPEKYSKEKFEVFIGTNLIDPMVIENQSEKESILRRLKVDGIEFDGEEFGEKFFRKVPINLKKAFRTNPMLALQNYCGIATSIKGRFLRNLKVLIDSYYENEKPWFPQSQVALSNGDSVELMDYLDVKNIEHPERPHSFFIDLSVAGDSGGFSCVRFDGEVNGQKQHTHIFTLEIIPPPYPNETRISKIFNFMSEINEIVNVVAFGSDQFQSKQLRQEVLAELNLTDTRLSIDSSDIFHLHWVRALVDKVLRMLYIKKLQTEVEEAEHDLKRRRVIKKKNSTDDLFQSVVGAYFLSDTVGVEGSGELPKVNVIGGQSVQRMLRKCGYKSSKS